MPKPENKVPRRIEVIVFPNSSVTFTGENPYMTLEKYVALIAQNQNEILSYLESIKEDEPSKMKIYVGDKNKVTPAEDWREELKKDYIYLSISPSGQARLERMFEIVIEEVIGKHNAEILNEYQLRVGDERIHMTSILSDVTKKTLSALDE